MDYLNGFSSVNDVIVGNDITISADDYAGACTYPLRWSSPKEIIKHTITSLISTGKVFYKDNGWCTFFGSINKRNGRTL